MRESIGLKKRILFFHINMEFPLPFLKLFIFKAPEVRTSQKLSSWRSRHFLMRNSVGKKH